MGKKTLIKNPYTGDITAVDDETGEKEVFTRYGGIFKEGIVSNKGTKISWDKDLFEDKNKQEKKDHERDTAVPFGTADPYGLDDEDLKRPVNGYQYYDPSKLPKNPSKKNLIIYCCIIGYCILASIFKFLPMPDMVCTVLLSAGLLQYAFGAGLDSFVAFREYVLISAGLWVAHMVCQTLIFVSPRGGMYRPDFWASAFKIAGPVYIAGLVLFALGRTPFAGKLVQSIKKK